MAGEAEDPGVSATRYSPFDRPELGRWLKHHADEFDTVVVWRLDRLVRSSKDLADLIAWADANGKGIVSASEGFDLDTPFGKAMATIIGALGQLEADTVRLRVADAHRALRSTTRWASGAPPFGFRAEPHPSGKGFGLVPDHDARAVLAAMAARVINGSSITRTVEWLNENYPARKWSTATVQRVLTSPATQGLKVHRGKPVLDDSGAPIRMAPATFDAETWEQLQAALAARTYSGKRRTHSPNPLLGVAYCANCGWSMGHKVMKRNRVDGSENTIRGYYCSHRPRNCPDTWLKADTLESLVTEVFLEERGSSPVIEQRFTPGSDNRADLEQTRDAIARLRAESDAGLVDDQAEYLSRLGALTERRKALEVEPYRPSRWEPVETDQTYAEAWEQADVDPERRRAMLVDAGVAVLVHRGGVSPWIDTMVSRESTPEQVRAMVEDIRKNPARP